MPVRRPAVQRRARASCSGRAREPDEPLEQRHRDIARSVQAMYEEAFFHLLDALHERYRTDALALAGGCAFNSVANGKIARALAVQAASTSSRPRAMPAARSARRSRSGTRSSGDKPAPLRDGPRLSGGRGLRRRGDRRALLAARRADLEAAGCTIERIADEATLCQRTARGDRRGQGGRLVPGPHGVGPARARQPLDPGRSAPRRHEGHPQPQDQAARVVPAVRALDPARGGDGLVRDRRRRALHDAGLPDPRRRSARRSRPSRTSTARAACRP